jgi:hypothetical protein
VRIVYFIERTGRARTEANIKTEYRKIIKRGSIGGGNNGFFARL